MEELGEDSSAEFEVDSSDGSVAEDEVYGSVAAWYDC